MTNSKFNDRAINKNILNIVGIDISEYELVDIRELHEQPRLPQEVCNYECWPLSEFEVHFPKISDSKKYLFFCQAGVRTLALIEQLHSLGKINTFSLENGVFAFQNMMEVEHVS